MPARLAFVVATLVGVALLVAGTASAAPKQGAGPGNSANAKQCQKGGWNNYVRSDGTTFASEGACTSYAAKGGVLKPKPPANRAPVAVDDAGSVKEDTAPNPVAGNVLANDSDADGDPLVVTSAGTFTLNHGSLVINANGSYSYTLDNSNPAVNALNDGQTLTDTFTYSVSDGRGGTASAKLAITINGTTD